MNVSVQSPDHDFCCELALYKWTELTWMENSNEHTEANVDQSKNMIAPSLSSAAGENYQAKRKVFPN